MGIFGPPNIGKLTTKKDVDGLIRASMYKKDASVPDAKAEAYAEVRGAAADALGDLGDPRAIEPLRYLSFMDDHHGVRVRATRALGNIHDPRAREPLIAALDSDSPEAGVAAEVLGRLADAHAIESLIRALQWESPGVRESALAALVEIGGPAVEALTDVEAYLDTDPYWEGAFDREQKAREAALVALGRIGARRGHPDATDRAAWALIEHLDNSSLFEAAVGALVEIGEPAIELLVTRLRHPDRFRGVAEALTRLGWAPDHDDAWYWVARGKYKKAVSLGAAAVEPLIARLRHNQPQHALAALVRIGEPAVEPLIALLPDTHAAEALGKIGDPRAIQPLIAELWAEQRSSDHYGAMVKALVAIGIAAVEPLVAALRRPPPTAIRDYYPDDRFLTFEMPARSVRGVLPVTSLRSHALSGGARNYGPAGVADALDELDWQPDRGDAGAWYWVIKGDYEKAVSLGASAVEPLIAAWDDTNDMAHRYQSPVFDDPDTAERNRNVADRLTAERHAIADALRSAASLFEEELTPAQRKRLEPWNAVRRKI